MNFVLLSPDLIKAIHDEVLNPGELEGMARDKSLEGALARVEHRLAYGMIDDVFDLAASYAMAVATGHCFNDANKRTGFRSMQVVLHLNGIQLDWHADDVGPIVIALAQGQIDDAELATWLRAKAP